MNIHEYQAKELLKQYGVAVLRRYVAWTPEEAAEAGEQTAGSGLCGEVADPCRRPRGGPLRRRSERQGRRARLRSRPKRRAPRRGDARPYAGDKANRPGRAARCIACTSRRAATSSASSICRS